MTRKLRIDAGEWEWADLVTWLIVAAWLGAGLAFVAGCRDRTAPPPAREPYPLQSAWQDAPS